MKPFNLEAALRGDPVVTRRGSEVTQLTQFETTRTTHSVGGVLNGSIWTWTPEGYRVSSAVRSAYDLFMAPKKKTVWLNMYSNGYAYHYESEQRADDSAASVGGRIGGKAYPVEIDAD